MRAVREAGAVQRATSICSHPACYLDNLDAPSEDELGPGSGSRSYRCFCNESNSSADVGREF